MKERVSFTFDKKTLNLIEELMNSGSFRNKSHIVESAIQYLEKEVDVNETKG